MKAEVGLLAVVTDPPAPEMMLQDPVPTEGALPAKVVEVAHKFWSGPALAVVGLARNVMITSSVEAAQGPFVIVHRKV